MKLISADQVAKHNQPSDCWVVVDGKVLDVTGFLAEHPGGRNVLLSKAGQDATKEFHMFHSPQTLQHFLPKLQIGVLSSSSSTIATKTTTKTDSSPHPLSPTIASKEFGDMIPYGDPNWYQGWNSPYYKESHHRFRAAIRDFVEREITPYVHEWDEQKRLPHDIWAKAYEAGWLPGVIGPPWPTEYVGSNVAGGVKPEEFDSFHEMILVDEVGRCGSGGLLWGLFGGISIALPPIMLFGSKYLKDKVVRDCLTGKKVICLCITEPSAGSDVANLTTRAEKTPDGKFYIVNGEKKFITNGVFADYFTVAVRTGPPDSGMNGISLLLLEKDMPGLKTRQMTMQGVWASGTTYITFEDVRVPVENLIGTENKGFRHVMHNFNHERFSVSIQCLRFARNCYEEAFKYAHKRKTFGKRLIDHPIIRFKLANMARQIEAAQCWLENIAYQLTTMSHDQAMQKLGGPIALLKAFSNNLLEHCSREASQVFGGLAYTRGGQGEKVERIYRDAKAYTFGGGSEEIMLDFAIRRASQQSKL